MPKTNKQLIQDHLSDPVSQAYIANRISQIDKQVKDFNQIKDVATKLYNLSDASLFWQEIDF